MSTQTVPAEPEPSPADARVDGLVVGDPSPRGWFGIGHRRDRDGQIACIFSAVLVDGTLVLEGELDLATAPILDGALRDVEARLDIGAPTVDLRSLDFMDCSGLRVLLAASSRARRAGRRLEVRQGAGEPARLIGVCGLDAVLALIVQPPGPA